MVRRIGIRKIYKLKSSSTPTPGEALRIDTGMQIL